MSNRPIVRLRELNQDLLILGRRAVFCLVALSLHRFLLFWCLQERFTHLTWSERLHAFFTGVRFDLLVLGFFALPVLALGGLFVLAPNGGRRFPRILRYYAGTAWTLISAIALLNFPFFMKFHRQLASSDIGEAANWFGSSLQAQSTPTMFMAIIIMIALWFLGMRSMTAPYPDVHLASDVVQPGWRTMVNSVVIVMVVGLMARGTVTAHHLAREHSVISTHQIVNELSVNSIWSLDKEVIRP